MGCCNFNGCRRCAPENYDDIFPIDTQSDYDRAKELKEKLKEAIEALEFYGNKELWRIGGGTSDIPMFNKIIESSIDSEWFKKERRHVSGGIARKVLLKLK